MKKAICIFYVFYSLFSMAQKKVSFGINTGMTYSVTHGNAIANENKYDFDFLIGTSIEVPLSKKISFFSGINYERKSYIREILFVRLNIYNPQDPTFSKGSGFLVNNRFSYLNIPLNLKCYLGNKNLFFIDGGLYTAIFLNSSSSLNGNENGFFKTLDFGSNLGLGKKIKLNEKVNLNVEIRDSYGLVNISKTPIYNDGILKLNSVNLILNWQF
jgi:Outer membrane protein beta-barrel domain